MINPSGLAPASSRLDFRRPNRSDAAFYLELTNEPDYIRFIRDTGLRTLADASIYIEEKALSVFREHGVGLWVVEEHSTGSPIGLCGLIVRAGLEFPDLGYAFLSAYRGRGYALEAARATVSFARSDLGVSTLCAITHPDNQRSARLLENVGFSRDGQRTLLSIGSPADYFVIDLTAPQSN